MARIDQVAAGTGRIGMMACPGTGGPSLEADLATIRDWGARVVVSLIEAREFEALGVTDLGAHVEALGLDWYSLPLADMAAPDDHFEAAWKCLGAKLLETLSGGGSILLHCRGGLGRTGMIAARLLVELGRTPDTAIAIVRAARPGAIETAAQEAYLRAPPSNRGNRR